MHKERPNFLEDEDGKSLKLFDYKDGIQQFPNLSSWNCIEMRALIATQEKTINCNSPPLNLISDVLQNLFFTYLCI